MKIVTELMVDAYLQGGNDAQGNGLWAISKHEKAINYAQQQVKLFAIPDVIGSYSEKDMDNAYDKGFKDAMVKYRTDL